jgi:hypothetical protein
LKEASFLSFPPSHSWDTVSPREKVLWPISDMATGMDSFLLKEEGHLECGQQFPDLWKNLRGLGQGLETFSIKG